MTFKPLERPSVSIGRSLAHSVLGTSTARIIGALGGIVAARALGPESRGAYGVTLLIATATSIAWTCGLQFWVAQQFALKHQTASTARVCAAQTMIATAIIGLITGPISTPLALWLQVPTGTIWWAAAYALTNGISLLTLAAPNGARDMKSVAVAVSGGAAAFVIALLILNQVDRVSVASTLAAGVCGNAVTVATSIASWRRQSHTYASKTHGPLVSTWLLALRGFTGAGFGELVLLGMFRADIVLVAAFLPLSDAGLYAVAVSYIEMLSVIPDATAQVALPAAADSSGWTNTARLTRLSLSTYAPLAAVAVLVSPLAIGLLFGASYRSAAVAVPLLAISGLGSTVWKVVGADVVVRGQGNLRLHSALVGLAVTITSNLLLVPNFGLIGASAASILSNASGGCIMIRGWRSLQVKPVPLFRFSRADLDILRAGRS